jgi:hypothetical protein
MKNRIILDSHRVILSCLIALLFGLTPAFAERPARGDGQAIRDKLQDVLNKTDTLGANLDALCDTACQASPAGERFKQKVEKLKRAQNRAKNAHARSQNEDFQEVVRKRGKKKDEGCDSEVQICTPDQAAFVSLASTEPEFDEERGKDIVEDLDDVAADVDELNEILAGNVPPPPPTVYAELENAEYFFPTSMWPSSEVVFAAFTANLVAEKASAIATHFCDQTAVALGFGGNGSAACAAVEAVHQVLDAVYQMMNYISQDVTSAEVTGTYKRTGNIYDQLLGSGGDINAVKMVVEAMGQKMLVLEENQKYIIQLLTTPQGQRPGFPKTTSAESK